MNSLAPGPRVVACGRCVACCHNKAVFLHPESGDNLADYDTVAAAFGLILRTRPNGDCIYLDRRTGCRIYTHRPIECRVFDCADALRCGIDLDASSRKAAKRIIRHLKGKQ
jgi:Fe-S-cluster containining protein